MEACIIPYSPSWYLSQVLDCSWDNKLAYGSFVNLAIVNRSDPSNPVTIVNAHADRILSVSFAPKSFGNYLLSTCAKGLSIVWDLENRQASSFHKHHKNNPTLGNWSHAYENLVVCADDNGGVSWWDVKSNVLNTTSFPGHSFNVVTCCPHNKDLVAAGTKQGNTYIINLKGKGSILHKLQDHGVEIASIVWCPVNGNILRSNTSQNEYLLASAARDRSVHFWRVGKDTFCEFRCDLPSIGPKASRNSFGNWTCLCWPQPNLLLASAVGGEIFSLKLNEISTPKGSQLVGRAAHRDRKVKWLQFSGKHGTGHVSIHSCPWKYCEKPSNFDWRTDKPKDVIEQLIWTSSADRVINGIFLKNGNVDIKLNTMGGAIHALGVSPIDGHSLAIGAADRSIRLVNLSESDFSNMKTIFIKHNAKVMALSWHPIKDGCLAYGTSDGHIDIHFARSNKPRLVLRKYTNESIYVLQWGPLLSSLTEKNGESENSVESASVEETLQFALYSVGGGRVAMHNPDHPEVEPLDPLKGLLPELNQSGKERQKVTDLSWKPDFTILAIGSDKGSVHLFHLNRQRTLQFISSVNEHVTLIQDLAWHPQSCTSDVSETSAQSNWLASASNDVKIRVLDVTAVLNSLENMESTELFNIKVPCIATLEGHRMRVAKVCWSPHQSGQLLSASYDQCVQVWDVPNRQPVACYVHHGSPVITCLWSPVNADFAISGGMDTTVRIWKISDQDQKLPIEKKIDSKQYLKDASEVEPCAAEDNAVNGKSGPFDFTCSKCKKRKEKAVLPLSGQAINDDALNAAIIQHLLQLPEDKGPKEKLDSSKSLPFHYGIFGDEEAMAQMVNAEYEANCAGAAWDSALIIDSWRGRVKEAISEAVKNSRISDFHVSLASMVSHKTWVETCSAYADQLKEGKEYSKATAYLLAIHRVEDAIKLLADNGKFRQALVIARSRLAPDDPMILQILNAWAEDSTLTGKFSIASICLAATGQWNNAARMVVRKQNSTRLLLAAQMMALKGNDKLTGLYYARECLYLSLKAGDWDTSRSVLESFPDLSHLSLLVQVHHSLLNFKKYKQISVQEWLHDKMKSCTSEVNDCTSACGTVSDTSASIHNIEANVSPAFDTVSLTHEMVSTLKGDLEGISTDTKEDALWLAVSSRVTLAVALAPSLFSDFDINITYDASISENTSYVKEALAFVVQSMALLYNHHILHGSKSLVSYLLKFCMWLFRKGTFESSKLLSTPYTPMQETIQSYLGTAVLFWLEDKKFEDENLWKQGLKIVDHFKTDVFSVHSLKWFKVDLQHRLLQNKKIHQESIKNKGEKKDTMKAGLECVSKTESQNDLHKKESQKESDTEKNAHGSQKENQDIDKEENAHEFLKGQEESDKEENAQVSQKESQRDSDKEETANGSQKENQDIDKEENAHEFLKGQEESDKEENAQVSQKEGQRDSDKEETAHGPQKENQDIDKEENAHEFLKGQEESDKEENAQVSQKESQRDSDKEETAHGSQKENQNIDEEENQDSVKDKNAHESQKDNSRPVDSELESLSIWLHQFEEERGKVPNPFVCYSRLVMVLKKVLSEKDQLEPDSLLVSYQKFWDDLNSQNDIV